MSLLKYSRTIMISFILFCLSCSSSLESNEGLVSVEILSPNLEIRKNDMALNISIQVKNDSEHSLLLYNFQEFEAALLSEDDYSNGRCTAGNAIFILDKFNSPLDVYTSVPNEIDWTPITVDTLLNVISRLSKSFGGNAIVLKKNSRQDLNVQLDLTGYELREGEYQLYLIYYTGKNLPNIVEKPQQKADEEKYKTEVFNGWVKSNTVKLIVE
ncbi:MAG: hypothetical protein L3J06_01065 [Cyclobacteriaceae bacterium]|nr:hypothetical protein [Cyclobacteriaceae bacterium]